MSNLLTFSSNSQLSPTDTARLTRIEASLPIQIAGRTTFSASKLAVPSATAVTSSGAIAPTGIQATGSTFAFVVQGNFAFTSTGTAITIYWDGTNGSKLLAIRRADGSNFSVTAGSMTISGLTSGLTYGFSAFIAVAQPAQLSFVQGDAGSPQFALSPTAPAALVTNATRTQRLTTNESITVGPITFTASSGGSGTGSGTYTGQ